MLLPLIAICSLLVAAAFAGVTWQVLREERRRADARVAALGALMDGRPNPATVPEGAPSAELFDTEHPSAVRGAPLTTLAIGFALAIVVIVAIAMTGGHPRTPHATPATHAGDSPAATTAPLELMSMRPERRGDALTVTGLVRNVSTAPEIGLIAVVFAFDRAGHFLSSARAPLALVTLQSGDESAFRVTVPNAAGVDRYRVSFRTDAGVVRHLDRRGATQASAN